MVYCLFFGGEGCDFYLTFLSFWWQLFFFQFFQLCTFQKFSLSWDDQCYGHGLWNPPGSVTSPVSKFIVYIEGSRPEWCISTISCLRYTILVGNPWYWHHKHLILSISLAVADKKILPCYGIHLRGKKKHKTVWILWRSSLKNLCFSKNFGLVSYFSQKAEWKSGTHTHTYWHTHTHAHSHITLTLTQKYCMCVCVYMHGCVHACVYLHRYIDVCVGAHYVQVHTFVGFIVFIFDPFEQHESNWRGMFFHLAGWLDLMLGWIHKLPTKQKATNVWKKTEIVWLIFPLSFNKCQKVVRWKSPTCIPTSQAAAVSYLLDLLLHKSRLQNNDYINNNEHISRALFHVKHAQLLWTIVREPGGSTVCPPPHPPPPRNLPVWSQNVP